MNSAAPTYLDIYKGYQSLIRKYLSKYYFAYLLDVSPSNEALRVSFEKVTHDIFIYNCKFVDDLLKLPHYEFPAILEEHRESLSRFFMYGDIEFIMWLDKDDLYKAIKKASKLTNMVSADYLQGCYSI